MISGYGYFDTDDLKGNVFFDKKRKHSACSVWMEMNRLKLYDGVALLGKEIDKNENCIYRTWHYG